MSDILDELWSEYFGEKIPGEVSQKWLEKVKTAHQQRTTDQNYCCDLTQLQKQLQHFQTCHAQLKNPLHVFCAVLFQAMEYDPRSSSNAEKCIEQFMDFVKEAEMEERNEICDCNQVKKLIELSISNSTNEELIIHDKGAFGTEDEHFFLDINFAVFASQWEEYESFAKRTRKEYQFLNDASYISLRNKVLTNFLQIPNIFATQLFREQYEDLARENIQKEIQTNAELISETKE